jgi:hypothetical protein
VPAASRLHAPREPPVEDDLELDPFADGGLFSEQLEPADAEDEFPLEDLGTIPGYSDRRASAAAR